LDQRTAQNGARSLWWYVNGDRNALRRGWYLMVGRTPESGFVHFPHTADAVKKIAVLSLWTTGENVTVDPVEAARDRREGRMRCEMPAPGTIPCAACGEPVYDAAPNAHVSTQRIGCPCDEGRS
jgi:hypothetical protein